MNILGQLAQLEKEATEFGFKWENTHQIMEQIKSECREVTIHLDEMDKGDSKIKELQEEIGDLLHAVFSLCIFCKLNPQETLEKSVIKFEGRLNKVKILAGDQGLTTLQGCTFETLMQFWNQAKLDI